MGKTLGPQYAMVIQRPHGENAFQHTGRTHGMAEMPLQTIDRHLRQSGTGDGNGFHLIVVGGGCSVRIDKSQPSGVKPSQHSLQSTVAALPFP